MHQRQREVEAPLHPARVAADAAVGGLREPHPVEQRLRALLALRCGDALEGRLQHQVLAAGQDRVERGLLQRRADRRAHPAALAHDVKAAHRCATACRWQQRREHVHRRGLARPVRSEEALDLPVLHRQVNAVYSSRSFAELAHQLVNLDCDSATAHATASYPNS